VSVEVGGCLVTGGTHYAGSFMRYHPCDSLQTKQAIETGLGNGEKENLGGPRKVA
jgi:hypothetical protein